MDPITLQELLDELAREGGSLQDLLRRFSDEGRLTVDEANRLETEAVQAFDQLRNAETISEADIEAMETLAAAVDGVRGERAHLTEQAEAQAQRVAEIAARVAPPAEDSETPAEGEGDADGDEDGEGEGDQDDADPDASDSGLTPQDVVDAEVVDTTTDGQPAAVAASAGPRRRVDLRAVANRAPRVNPANLPRGNDLPFGGALVASAGTGRREGSSYDSWVQLGDTAARMFKSATPSQLQAMVAGAQRNGQDFYQRNGIAEFRMDFPEELIAYGTDDTEVFERAADQSRLPGGSLLAAGGWCSPSETMYDLCDLPCSLDGILSLPEVGAPRGGVRWTKGLDFCEIYNSPGFWHFTETELMADPAPVKPVMEIPCVDFDEARLDVDGLTIVGDIPQARTYPEVVAQFIQGAMCAHAHRINARKLATISAGSVNDGAITQAGYGAVASVLYAIELEIQAYRYRGRRAQEGTPAVLELVAPYWIKGVLRADIANRNAPSGIGNPLMVTDADIMAWFASRGVAPRFVYDWQDLIDCTTTAGPPVVDPNRPVTDYPNNVEFMIYEAGTWIVPQMDVITLESLYDSTLIAQNKYTALFTEQAFTVVQRCNGSRRFTVPICATGATGAQVAVACA